MQGLSERGARTVVREYVTIHRATRADAFTEIGEDCLLMATCHVAHDCRLGDGVIVINYAGLTGHCEIGDRATIGGYVGLVPFTRVGTLAYIGGCAKVNQDVPPFMIADGNPAEIRGINLVGLERKSFPPESVKLIKEAFRLIFRSKYNRRQAIEAMQKELPQTQEITEIIQFIEHSERGIIR